MFDYKCFKKELKEFTKNYPDCPVKKSTHLIDIMFKEQYLTKQLGYTIYGEKITTYKPAKFKR